MGITENSHKISFLILNYKSFVFSQKASGCWSENLFSILKEKNLVELQTLQTDPDLKTMGSEMLLTLVGIKILSNEYKDNKKEWKLVVHKARQFLKKTFNKTDAEIDEMINKVLYDTII